MSIFNFFSRNGWRTEKDLKEKRGGAEIPVEEPEAPATPKSRPLVQEPVETEPAPSQNPPDKEEKPGKPVAAGTGNVNKTSAKPAAAVSAPAKNQAKPKTAFQKATEMVTGKSAAPGKPRYNTDYEIGDSIGLEEARKINGKNVPPGIYTVNEIRDDPDPDSSKRFYVIYGGGNGDGNNQLLALDARAVDYHFEKIDSPLRMPAKFQRFEPQWP